VAACPPFDGAGFLQAGRFRLYARQHQPLGELGVGIGLLAVFMPDDRLGERQEMIEAMHVERLIGIQSCPPPRPAHTRSCCFRSEGAQREMIWRMERRPCLS
jgi:hypothetical protein